MVNQPSKQATVTYSYKPPTSEDKLGEFEQNHRSYQLFKQKGLDKVQIDANDIDVFGKPIFATERILSNGIFAQLRDFLNQVDLSKGPIVRKVDRLERRRDSDPVTHKKVEHLVIHTTWIAQDYLGNEIQGYDIKEGLHNEPITRVEVEKGTGRRLVKYVNWRPIYDIPFSQKAVDEALEDNINNIEDIRYLVRVGGTRDDSFTLEQFRDSTWEQVVEINKQGKGLNR